MLSIICFWTKTVTVFENCGESLILVLLHRENICHMSRNFSIRAKMRRDWDSNQKYLAQFDSVLPISYQDKTPTNTTQINHLVMIFGLLFQIAPQNKLQVKEIKQTMDD